MRLDTFKMARAPKWRRYGLALLGLLFWAAGGSSAWAAAPTPETGLQLPGLSTGALGGGTSLPWTILVLLTLLTLLPSLLLAMSPFARR